MSFMSVESEAIGARIATFLEGALIDLEPERDAPVSAQICGDLLKVLDNAAAWEVAEAAAAKESWRHTLGGIAMQVSMVFKDRSEQWSRVAKLAAIYIRSAWVPKHCLARLDMQRRQPVGPVLHYVELDFATPFLRGLLSSARAEQRAVFFDEIKSWEVWTALANALDSFRPTSEELAAAFRSFDTFSRNDGARGDIFEKLMAWAVRAPDVVQRVVDGWLNQEPAYATLDREPIRLLVEALVEHHGADEKIIAWRDRLIDNLSRRNEEHYWKLAALLACFAWPKDPPTPVAVKHALLLEHVRRFPGRLVTVGLLAMVRDAREWPTEAVDTTIKLLEMAPTDAGSEYPLIVAQIAHRTLLATREKGCDVSFLDPLLPVLLHIPIEQSGSGIGLDSFLAMLFNEDAARARSFVTQWLEHHASAPRDRILSLEDILPSLVHKMGPVQESVWITGFMVSPAARLRMMASYLLGARRGALPAEAYRELDEKQVRALAHLLAGGPILGKVWVPALFRLALAKPAAMSAIRSILLEDAAINYPSSCRASMKIWSEAKGLLPDVLIATGEILVELERRLAELDASHNRKRSIGELAQYHPAHEAWIAEQQRIMDSSFQSAQSRSALIQLATRMPVARGSHALMSFEQQQPTELKEHTGSFELPIAEALDPLGARLARFEHYQKAEALLAGRDNEEQPS
jgi:hypothetical protein